MLQNELTKVQASQAGEQLLELVDQRILERGYAYYSDGAVFNTRVEQGRFLTCSVQGSVVYKVTLDLQEVRNSTCSCPCSLYCEHIAAAFFQLYSVFDNPRQFLSRAAQPRMPVFHPSMLIPADRDPFLRGADVRASASSVFPLEESSSAEEWWAFMESRTRSLPAAMAQHRASAELMSSLHNLLSFAADWEVNKARLFSIHAVLFHLLKLHEFANSYRHSHWTSDLTQTAEKLIAHLEGSLFAVDVRKLQSDYAKEWEATLNLTGHLKHETPHSLSLAYAYRMIWWELGEAAKSRIQAEVDGLERSLQNPALSDSQKETYRILRAHFAVQEGDDRSGLFVWLSIPRIPLSFYLYYIKSFARNAEWQRILLWTNALERLIADAPAADYRLAIAIWMEAMRNDGKSDDCGPLLRNFLPGSFREYAAYLERTEADRAWVDLHMTYQTTLAELTPACIKRLEETRPSLLFPLYLREVNRLIRTRNRPAYREAVKWMKKARTLYARAGKQTEWNVYVRRLTEKYQRLRAFQEEVRRANLSL